jgi:hypothetical protein
VVHLDGVPGPGALVEVEYEEVWWQTVPESVTVTETGFELTAVIAQDRIITVREVGAPAQQHTQKACVNRSVVCRTVT